MAEKANNRQISFFETYTEEDYLREIKTLGFRAVWKKICALALSGKNDNPILLPENFGNLYEMGLAHLDKEKKKNSGQYYTPDDVAKVMAIWLAKQKGECVCDIGCGTGNLILTYLDVVGKEEARRLLRENRIYLYENDVVALDICKTSILAKYGSEFEESINTVHADFLNADVRLPENCKVISNPPYSVVENLLENWEKTEVAEKTKELYAMFMEKILIQSEASVIITPYSFIGSSKFYPLRKIMNCYNGFTVSFDNVPGNIFAGRKHGIFNTNKANSVRAAITVVENRGEKKGFKFSPLLRFKTEERKDLLDCDLLEGFVSDRYQTVSERSPSFAKCHKDLQTVFDKWVGSSQATVKDLLSKEETPYPLYMPNTCRYFTTASSTKLYRTGVITMHARDRESYEFLYCLINSSFVYWWWRIYDGGITYPKWLLESVPVFTNLLRDEDRAFFKERFEEMQAMEKSCKVTKLNAGSVQENIKFPKAVRSRINQRILQILGLPESEEIFCQVHANKISKEG